jgi:hypothetical protein
VTEKLLTQAEVDALPTGTEVWVVWSGGNGPHRYQIQNEGGEAHVDAKISSNDTRIDFVGKERYNCHVWLADTDVKGKKGA